MADIEPMQGVIYHCQFCMEAFVCEETYTQHINNHTTERPFECKTCAIRFITEEHLQKHVSQKHSKEELYKACSVCGKLFHDNITLKSHMAVHSVLRPYICNICKKSFKRKGELDSHSVIHAKHKRFKCTTCHKTFTQKYTLVLHMRCHTGERPFKCMKCGKDFNRISSVRVHMRTHNNEKPYQCTKCNISFKLLRDQKKHMEKVHGKATEKIISKSVREKSGKKSVYKKRGGKPVIKSTLENKGNYECTMCEKIFESVNEFSDHVLSHDVDTCFLCGHKLKSKTDKRRHVTRPVTLKESQCFTCGLKFSLLSEFQEHMNGHSELCRLEECLKNAENLHNLSKEIVNSTQPSDSSKTYDSEENTLFKAMEVMHDHDATDQVQVMDEDIMESCNVSLKEHDFCGEDNHPDTAVLEIEAVHDEISGHHSLRSSNVTSSELKKKTTVTHTLDASLTTSIKEKSSSIKEFSNRRNSYRVSSVSPPRTRGSLKKDITVDEISIVKNIENKPIKKEKSPKKTAKKKDLECEDNKDFVHDLAASYSIYVKNMLRLQPVEKQMAMIKAINSAIAHFISD